MSTASLGWLKESNESIRQMARERDSLTPEQRAQKMADGIEARKLQKKASRSAEDDSRVEVLRKRLGY